MITIEQMKMTIHDLVNILSGSSIQEYERDNQKAYDSFPPKAGTVWRFKRYSLEKEHLNRVLVTNTFDSGQWTTVTVVTSKGIAAGDYTSWEWIDTFEPVF